MIWTESLPASRVYWFRARASAARWHEEIQILREEMRRTLRFFKQEREGLQAIAEAEKRKGNLGRAAYSMR